MHIIVGLLLFLVLLYFWLLTHWFARIIVFIVFAIILGFIGWAGGTSLQMQGQSSSGGGVAILGVLFLFGGVALAWPLSGLPLYYWRRRASPRLVLR